MDTTEIERLCKDVEYAAAELRTLIGDRTEISEVLDRFWLLQDSLTRLIEVVVREYGDMAQCRSIIPKIVNAMESQQIRKLRSVPGVKLACEAINSSLTKLELITKQAQVADSGLENRPCSN